MDKQHLVKKEKNSKYPGIVLDKHKPSKNFSSTESSTSCSSTSSESTSECTTGGCVGNTIYVDSICGDDQTGRPFSSNYPYLTIKAAIAAASKPAKKAVIEILVRPGTYLEGRIFLINNISLQGSGQLVTQVIGSFDTSLVTDQATVLELTISSNENPAIFGYGSGSISFRRMQFLSTYVSGVYGQSGALIVNGTHTFTDANGNLDNTGGTDVAIYRHLGGYLDVQRNNHTITSAALPQIIVPPNVMEFVPEEGGVEYVLTGTNQVVKLPYKIYNFRPRVLGPKILTPFLITQQSGGPSRIEGEHINQVITSGQTFGVSVFLTAYVLKLVSGNTLSLENSNIYKIGDDSNSITIASGESLTLPKSTTNVPLTVNITGGSGTLTLLSPENIGPGYIINTPPESNYNIVRPIKDIIVKIIPFPV